MAEFTTRTEHGIREITWDLPGRSMNVLSMDGIGELETLVADALADDAVRGILITSAKDSFAGGMDLAVLASMKAAGGDDPAASVFAGLMRMHRLLRTIERAGMDPKTLKGGKPVAAALPGTALGIGLELPLACHRIFAADRMDARIGLPEIKLGLFPGAGGATRLSRKLGLMAAAGVLFEGRTLTPAKAQTAGLIDEVVAPDALRARALAWLRTAGPDDLVKPWDRKGFRMPGGPPYDPEGFMTFVGAAALVHHQTQGVYPAARAMLQAIYEGAQVAFDTALRIEARHFTSVLLDPSSEAMIRTLFLNKQALEKGARRPASQPPATPRRVGVLGAGMMGAGIAHVAAGAGLDVVLIDRDDAAAEKGKARSAALLEKAVGRGSLTPETAEARLARIAPGADYAALAGCDLIVEAVFEDPTLKAEVIARAEAAAPEAVIASNTSTLPIAGLARASARPERFIGIHFFSPVDRMALVEVIRGSATGDAALAAALDFVRALKKTPIVVEDARFFYANRCILPYLNEGMRMLAEGVPPALIENAAKTLGMPVGPLQLADEVSLSLGAKIAEATRAAMGDAYPDGDVDRVLALLLDAGRAGRQASAGFYDYADGRRTGLWPGLAEAFAPAPPPDPAEVKDRLLYVQVLEAVRALEAGVLTDPREGDVGAVLGWGFAPWSGGPFSWLDRVGAAAAAVERADALALAHGARFNPPALLRQQAAEGGRFYPSGSKV